MLNESFYEPFKEYSMLLKSPKIYFVFLVFTLAVTTQACGVAQNTSPTATDIVIQSQPPTVEFSNLSVPTAENQNTSLVEISNPAVEITPTPISPIVTVTVINGDLSIRTGPDISFDAIAKLQDGETVTALARSIMDGWVQIQIPSRAGETGWISTQTNYSITQGNLLDLPRINIVEWNVGSYLINCTPHQMIVKPGNVILEPIDDAPANRVWFSPGVYSVYDMDVEGQPVAANLSVTEHREFHILKDGTRKQWSCSEGS
jgi:hypothetical protein